MTTIIAIIVGVLVCIALPILLIAMCVVGGANDAHLRGK